MTSTKTPRVTSRLFLVFALPLLIGSLAACSGENKPSEEASNPSSQQSVEDWQIAYKNCLREEGVETGKDGQMSLSGGEEFAEADERCRERVGESPVGDVKPLTDAEREAARAELVTMAECLRDAGYDVDDPTPDGGLELPDDLPEGVAEQCAPNGSSGSSTGP